MARVFSLDANRHSRLVAALGNQGKDAIFDRLLDPTKKTQRLIYPKPYAALLEAIDAIDKAQRDAKFNAFLDQWYPSMKRAYWYDSHELDGAYFGYWAVEAAGIVVAYGFDDSAFRGHDDYPSGLTDFGENAGTNEFEMTIAETARKGGNDV